MLIRTGIPAVDAVLGDLKKKETTLIIGCPKVSHKIYSYNLRQNASILTDHVSYSTPLKTVISSFDAGINPYTYPSRSKKNSDAIMSKYEEIKDKKITQLWMTEYSPQKAITIGDIDEVLENSEDVFDLLVLCNGESFEIILEDFSMSSVLKKFKQLSEKHDLHGIVFIEFKIDTLTFVEQFKRLVDNLIIVYDPDDFLLDDDLNPPHIVDSKIDVLKDGKIYALDVKYDTNLMIPM